LLYNAYERHLFAWLNLQSSSSSIAKVELPVDLTNSTLTAGVGSLVLEFASPTTYRIVDGTKQDISP
jgi:hypothetical protein